MNHGNEENLEPQQVEAFPEIERFPSPITYEERLVVVGYYTRYIGRELTDMARSILNLQLKGTLYTLGGIIVGGPAEFIVLENLTTIPASIQEAAVILAFGVGAALAHLTMKKIGINESMRIEDESAREEINLKNESDKKQTTIKILRSRQQNKLK